MPLFGINRLKNKYTNKDRDTWGLYDAHANRSKDLKETNVFFSTGHFVKVCVGSGILAMPYAFSLVGLWTGLIVCIIIGPICAFCTFMLVRSAQTLYKRINIPTLGYSQLAEASVGTCRWAWLRKFDKTFRYIVELSITSELFGATCVMITSLASMIKQLVDNTDDFNIQNVGENTLNLRLFTLIVLPFVLLICMVTELKYLSPLAILGDIGLLICVGATIYYGVTSPVAITDMPAHKGIIPMLDFIGILVFSMEGIAIALPIENQMKKPHKFYIVTIGTYVVVTTLITAMGFFGYWAFGEELHGSILLNFPMTHFNRVLKVIMVIVLYIGIGVLYWIPFNVTWVYLRRHHDEKRWWIYERIWRAVIIIILACISIAVGNIGNFLGILGAFTMTTVGFTYPAFIDTIVHWDEPGMGPFKIRLIVNILIAAFGCFLMTFGTVQNVRSLIKNVKEGNIRDFD